MMDSQLPQAAAGTPDSVGSESPTIRLMQQANEAYRQGLFGESFQKYSEAIDQGSMSSGVYYNFGNAAFRVNNPGLALASFRIAEDLAPRDREISANIAFVQNSLGLKREGYVASWHDRVPFSGALSGREAITLCGLFLSVVFVLLAIAALLKSLSSSVARGLRAGATVALFGAFVSGFLFLVIWDRTAPRSRGVVDKPMVSLRSEASSDSLELYTLPRGAEFRVIEELPLPTQERAAVPPLFGARDLEKRSLQGAWLRVQYDSETKGWLKSEEVILF